jgi:hypothetical protein
LTRNWESSESLKVKGAGDAGVEWAVPMNGRRFLTSCDYVIICAKPLISEV